MINYNVPFENPTQQTFIIGATTRSGSSASGENNRTVHQLILPDCQFVYIFCVGAGGGGNGGSTTSGGGGGGSGAICRVMYPRFALPNTLCVSVGRGGTGGAAGSAGLKGGLTVVATNMDTNSNSIPNTTNILCSANGGEGNATPATGGVAGAVTALTGIFPAMMWGCHSVTTPSLAGQAGGAGGAGGANGTSITYPITGILVSGGGGGAGNGAATTGGTISAFGQHAATVATAGVDGPQGISILPNYNPKSTIFLGDSAFMCSKRIRTNVGVLGDSTVMVATGGTGGSGSTGTGFTGGAGGFGSGGGGGGGGTSAGGRGGNGGDGLCVIVCN